MAQQRYKQNVPVPIGGGMDQGSEEFTLQPPSARDLVNLSHVTPGGLRKRQGWTYAYTTANSVGPHVLASNGSTVLDIGVTLPYRKDRASTGWGVASGRPLPPVRLESHFALSLPGRVSYVNIAVNGDYVALCGLHSYVQQADLAGATDTSAEAWMVIMRGGTVVGGPWTVPTMNMGVTVHPLTIGGVKGFAMLGLYDLGLGTYTLNGTRVLVNAMTNPGSSLGVTTIATNLPTRYYAAHSQPGEPQGYLCYADSGGVNTVCRSFTGSTFSGASVVGGFTSANVDIWHEPTSETVMVGYATGANVYIYSADEALSAWAATGATASTHDAIWYEGTGGLYFAGRAVSITGTAPGTPSIGSEVYPMLNGTFTGAEEKVGISTWYRRPQRLDGIDSPIFFGYEEGLFCSYAMGVSGFTTPTNSSERSWVDAIVVDADGDPITLVPLQQTRHGTNIATGAAADVGTPAAQRHPSAIAQSARGADNAVYVPFVTPTSAAPKGSIPRRWETWGYWEDIISPNQDMVIGYTRISGEQSELHASTLFHQNSQLLLAGNLVVWDGSDFFDMMGPPEIGYDIVPGGPVATPTAALATPRGNYGLDCWSGGGARTHKLADVKWWSVCVVLVATDANGVEWRSAPSNQVWIATGELNYAEVNGEGTGVTAGKLPVIPIRLDPSHMRVLKSRGSLDVEVYVTQRDDGTFARNSTGPGGATNAADIVHEYYLAQRTPIQYTATPYGSIYRSVDRGVTSSAGLSNYYVVDYLFRSYQGGEATDYVSIPLYTDSGELAPVRPPAARSLASAAGYAFLVPAERPWELWPSKPLERGRGPEFAPELVLNAPSEAGEIVSLAAQGDRLLLLCQNGIWELFVGGGGPDATGAGSFGAFRLLHLGDGCATERGTVFTPAGVFYMSNSGAKVITADGSVQDIGRPVDTLFTAADVTSAVYDDANNEVVICTAAGLYFYNLDLQAWSRSDVTSLFLTTDNSGVVRLEPTGTISYQNPAAPDDAGTHMGGKYVSPWLSFSSPLGYDRCRRIAVQVRCISGTQGRFRIQLAYNRVNSDVDSFLFDYTTVSALDIPGLMEVKPSRQKFDSIRITVSEVEGVSGGEPLDSDILWALTGIEFEVSGKVGVMKIQAEGKQ